MLREFRSHLRDLIAKLLLDARATEPDRTLRGRLSVITFHRVLPEAERDAYPLPGLVVTPAELEWFLSFFGRYFECGTLSQSVRRWDESMNARKPVLAITFDDGQLDNWRYARPVLDRLGMKASFFVPVNSIEDGVPLWHDRIAWAVAHAVAVEPAKASRLALEVSPTGQDLTPDPHRMVLLAKTLQAIERERYVERWESLAGPMTPPDWEGFMGWDELRSLSESGHEIGSHSMSHAILPLCTSEEIQHEVAESRRIIESNLEASIESFCYPNGDCDSRCVDAVERSGYRQAVTTAWGANPDAESRFEMRRFDMRSDHAQDSRGNLSAARVAWRISGFHPGLT